MIEHSDYRARAHAIVDRVLPELPSVHGWDDPHGFAAASARRGDRSYLFWHVFARLRAKAEGGLPSIALPPDSEHCLSGSGMWRAAKEFERQAAA